MSALGRLVAKTLRKEVGDVFADYALKSEDVVAESVLGQTKAKPAASYIKEMQKQGVSDEEMRDLGLIEDFDPKTGPRRQEQLTRDQMLDEINTRRQERLTGDVTVRQIDPFGTAKTPDEAEDVGTPMFSEHTPDVGDAESYQEIVYSQRGGEQSRLNEALGDDPKVLRDRDTAGMHFPETDQLFHLRVNRGTTEDQQRVTNILEIQSDIQQRKQRPPVAEQLKQVAANDPNLPMIENWEKLGVKEAIKLAIKRGDRYVAVPPGTEIAESVMARETVPEATDVLVSIERGKDPISGKEGDLVSFEPAGVDIRGAFGSYLEDAENIGDNIAATVDLQIVDDLFGEPFDPEEMGDLVRYYLNVKFNSYSDSIELSKARQDLIEGFEQNIAGMLAEDGLDPMSFTDFMEEYILPRDFVLELSSLEDDIVEQGFNAGLDITRRYFVDDVAKELGITTGAVRKAAKNNERLTIPEGAGFGGRGLSSFYDEALLSPKRVENYGGFPVVTIKQYRGRSGDLVETQALDLQQYYTNQVLSKENKPFSLYTPAAVGLFASYLANKFIFGSPAQDQQSTNEGPMMAEGGLLDEGGTVDPVSGNDVPSGSTKEEVRDDIDAKLSEGEFVLPADVVRYIGLENLMELRQKAKQGLAKMEKMGQMGNAEEATLSDDVEFTAEIDNMIDNIGPKTDETEMAFNTGGIVPSPGTPTYLNQQTPTYQQAGAVLTTPQYTGQQQAATQSVYQPQQFVQLPAPGQFTQPAVTQPATDTRVAPTEKLPYEMKKFQNEAGNVIYIPFMNGEPSFPIPEGYKEVQRDPTAQFPAEEAKPETAVETAKVVDAGGDGGFDTSTGTTTVTGKTSVGIARAIQDINPNAKNINTSLKNYRSAQIKGIGGAILSAVTGGGLSGLIGAGVSIGRMNQKLGEIEGQLTQTISGSKTDPTLISVLNAVPEVTGKSSDDIQRDFTNAVEYGLSPGLAAALATTQGSFMQPTLEIDAQGNQRISIPEQGFGKEAAVRNAFSPETIGTQAYNDLVEQAAFYDATGMGTMTLASETGYAARDMARTTAPTPTQQRIGFDPTTEAIFAAQAGVRLGRPTSTATQEISRGVEPSISVTRDIVGEQVKSSNLMDLGSYDRANSALTQAVQNIARSDARVDVGDISINSVDPSGNLNLDINGDGITDRRTSVDPATGRVNTYNFNIDRSNDNYDANGRQTVSGARKDMEEVGFDEGDTGDTGGDSKIVCTAMNDAYGFGTFRQTIWLNHSKHLDPAYEKGYHRIFKPLVRYAYKDSRFGSKQLRAILEHIARHRTADIWKQRHGKRDLIGAIERAILEPICFIAGKF